MQTVSNISLTLIFMGAVQGIFFALLLLSIRHGRVLSNRILAALLIIVSAGFVSVIGIIISDNQSVIRFSSVSMSVIVACIPLLFLYVKALTVRKFRFSAENLAHFLPVALCVVYLLIFNTPEYGMADTLSQVSHGHKSVITVMVILYALPYLLSIFMLMKSHSYNTVRLYRESRTVNPTVMYKLSIYMWVRNLLIACSIYWTLSIVSFFYRDFEEYYFIIPACSSAMIYILGYLGLRNPGIFYLPDASYFEHKHEQDGGE